MISLVLWRSTNAILEVNFWKQLKGLWLQAPYNEVVHLNERQLGENVVHFTQISKHWNKVEDWGWRKEWGGIVRGE